MKLHSEQNWKSLQKIVNFCRAVLYKMRYLGIVTLILLLFVIYAVSHKFDRAGTNKVTDDHPITWGCLLFTQQWPPSVCLDKKTQHCMIPNETKFWTIHGIWPNWLNQSEGPNNCNRSWPFHFDELAPIQDVLEYEWPDLMDAKPSSTFWSHEWVKHGTCASILPALDSILKYFQQGLALKETYNLSEILSNAGIQPALNITIKVDTVRNALEKQIGSKVRIRCTYKDIGLVNGGESAVQHYLSEVSICLDKVLQPMDCLDSSSDCPKKGMIYLPLE